LTICAYSNVPYDCFHVATPFSNSHYTLVRVNVKP